MKMVKNIKESQLIMERRNKIKKKQKIELPLNQIICDFNARAMRKFSDNSIDSILTDPPYGLEFMGKEWDKLGASTNTSAYDEGGRPTGRVRYDKSTASMQKWHYKWAKECLRIAKPGAFMLVFGGTRTFHRLTCAIEDAGWQIRDCMMWLYGSGFPKSLDISKAIDKMKSCSQKTTYKPNYKNNDYGKGLGGGKTDTTTKPNTNLTQLWNGYGTAFKPAWEPIIVAMKPVDTNFAKNAERYGVAGLNINAARIGTDENLNGGTYSKGAKQLNRNSQVPKNDIGKDFIQPQGRWPANVILDSESAKLLDLQSGDVGGRIHKYRKQPTKGGMFGLEGRNRSDGSIGICNSGGASRFFYIAKASRSERNAGCGRMSLGEPPASARGKFAKGRKSALGKPRQNFHPTVKPLQLMQYLCMLLKMPNKDQIILDPFVGSGTTCIACKKLGINYIGIDKDKNYCEIARKRLKAVKANLFENLPKKKSKKKKTKESFGLCE